MAVSETRAAEPRQVAAGKSSFRPRKKSTGPRSTSPGEKTSAPPIPLAAADGIAFPAYEVERWPLARIIPNPRNARKHRPSQVAEIAASIREFGFVFPMLVDPEGDLVAGEGRYLASKSLAIVEVPVIVARGWTDAQKRAFRLADNQIALHATWDKTMLRVELADLRDQGVDLELMGFTAADALGHEDTTAGDLPQALQLRPAREYAVIMCADLDEWERLKVALSLTPVRRGGYKKGSLFDDVGTQRVVTAAAILALIERRGDLPKPTRTRARERRAA
jgi:ParB-like nuclease domain